MPTAGSHVDDILFEEIKEAAHREGMKNLSGFVRAAILEKMGRQDKATMPTAKNANCLVTLTEDFAPTYAAEMRERCEAAKMDQPKVLALLLKLFAISEGELGDAFLGREYGLAAEAKAPYGKDRK